MIPTHQEIYNGIIDSARDRYKLARSVGVSRERTMLELLDGLDSRIRRLHRYRRELKGPSVFHGRRLGATMRARSYLRRVVRETDKNGG